MKNRIKELREARNLTFQALADAIADSGGGLVQASTVQKLETGAMKLTMEWIERIGKALKIDPVEVIDDRPRAGSAEPDVAAFAGADGPPSLAQPSRAGHTFMRVTSNVLDEIGIFSGDIVEVNEAGIARHTLETGDVVTADVALGTGDSVTTVLREFLEPSQLVTNSRNDAAMPINMRTARTTITGIVVGTHRQMRKR